MLRKYFRKWLPSHETIRTNRYVAWLGPRLQHHNLWHLHRRSVAGGIAVGLFSGLIPGSNPVQFAASALLAIVGRVNLPIAVVVTLYSNPLTIVPLYYCAFRLGQLALLQSGGELPPLALDLGDKGYGEWLSAILAWLESAGKPLAIGVPLFAVLLALVGYCLVDWTWQVYVRCAWQARRRRRARMKS